LKADNEEKFTTNQSAKMSDYLW